MGFALFESLPHRISLPLVTRVILPALISFEFEGYSDYLEDLAAQIDCPKLKTIKIWYFHQFTTDFQAAHFSSLSIARKTPGYVSSGAWMFAFVYDICLQVFHMIDIILCGAEWGLSHVIRLFGQFFTKLCDVRHLSIGYYRQGPEISNNDWVRLLHPFTAAQTLYVCRLWIDECHRPDCEDISATEENILPVLCIDCPQW